MKRLLLLTGLLFLFSTAVSYSEDLNYQQLNDNIKIQYERYNSEMQKYISEVTDKTNDLKAIHKDLKEYMNRLDDFSQSYFYFKIIFSIMSLIIISIQIFIIYWIYTYWRYSQGEVTEGIVWLMQVTERLRKYLKM